MNTISARLPSRYKAWRIRPSTRKAGLLIRADRAPIVSKHSQGDALQVQFGEPIAQDHPHRIRAIALAPTLAVANPDPHFGIPMAPFDVPKANKSDQAIFLQGADAERKPALVPLITVFFKPFLDFLRRP